MATFEWHSTDNCWQFITQSIHLCVLFCIVPRIHLWQPIHVRLLFADNALFWWIPHTHTHPFNGPSMCLLLLPRWAGTRKVKPIWILLKQETVCGNGISWAICKSAPHSRQITTPAPHHSRSFLQAGCTSCRPTNSVKALKAFWWIPAKHKSWALPWGGYHYWILSLFMTYKQRTWW